MKVIESIQANHKKMMPGIYVSRKELVGNHVITEFDLRFKRPNADVPMPTGSVHTIEHLGNFYLNELSLCKDEIIYFGPMGSRTGFRLIMEGDFRSEDISEMITKMCDFVVMHSGEIPGTAEHRCGNCLDHDMAGAKFCALEYLEWLKNDPHYEYPL